MSERCGNVCVGLFGKSCTCEEPVGHEGAHRMGLGYWSRSKQDELIDSLRAELASVQAALAYEISRRTIGGAPPEVDPNWGNITSAPDSASDPRMPAHRRVGMARSTDQRSDDA